MAILELPVAKVQQGELTLYATAIRVKVLINEDFYSVETLDPQDRNESGYQRILNQARARRLADYIVKGQDNQDAFLPTSVFLATDKHISFDPVKNRITFDTDEIGPFNVVDGQHRLEGLKMAANRDDRVLEFSIPVNIAADLPNLHQMCHFLIVNTTQKSVDKAVEQRITARLTRALGIEDTPTLPKWILNVVEKGEVDKATRLVDYLNSEPNSPWCGKIRTANDPKQRMINERSMVQAIVRYVCTANNPIASLRDFEKEKKIFLNYWISIASIIDDENNSASVLYRYNSAQLFCRFSIPFFLKLFNEGVFTVPAMTSLLSDCFDSVEGEYAGIGHAQFWRKGGKASGLNMAAVANIAQELASALHKSSMNVEIVL